MDDETSFLGLVTKHFGFLISEYNFTMRETISVFGKAITYQSPKLSIEICRDRGSIFVFLKPVEEPETAQLELLNILEALSVQIPQEFQGPLAYTRFDYGLANYAMWLKLKCDNVLRGDLSEWVRFLDFNLEKMKKDYLSRTKGKPLPKRAYQKLEDYIKSKSST